MTTPRKIDRYYGHLVDAVTGEVLRAATNGEWRALKNSEAQQRRAGDDDPQGSIVVDNRAVVLVMEPSPHSGLFGDGKAAASISARRPTDAIERTIHAAARYLTERGDGDALYLNHYTSGSTLWRTGNGFETIRRKVDVG